MKYRATIITDQNTLIKYFNSMREAANWLDSENNNFNATTIIETLDDARNKKDGFIYTEKAK